MSIEKLTVARVWDALVSLEASPPVHTDFNKSCTKLCFILLATLYSMGYSLVSKVEEEDEDVEDLDSEDRDELTYLAVDIATNDPVSTFRYFEMDPAWYHFEIEYEQDITEEIGEVINDTVKTLSGFMDATFMSSQRCELQALSSHPWQSSKLEIPRLEASEFLSKLSTPDLWRARGVSKEWQKICVRQLQRSGPWVLMCARDKNSSSYHEVVWYPSTGFHCPVRVPNPTLLHRVIASSGGLVCSQLVFETSYVAPLVAGLCLMVGDPFTNKWKELPRLRVAQVLKGRRLHGCVWDVQMKATENGDFRVIAVPKALSIPLCYGRNATVPIVFDSRVGSWKRLRTPVCDVPDCSDWAELQVGTWEDIENPVFVTYWDFGPDPYRLEEVYVIDKLCCWKIELPAALPVEQFAPLNVSPSSYPDCSTPFHWIVQGLRDECSGRIFIVCAVKEWTYLRGLVIYEVQPDKSCIMVSHATSQVLFGESVVPLPVEYEVYYYEQPFKFSLQGGFIIVTTRYDPRTHGFWKPVAYNLAESTWSSVEMEDGIDYDGVCIFTPSFKHKNEELLQEEKTPCVVSLGAAYPLLPGEYLEIED